MESIPEPLMFDWDEGNWDKNYLLHKVINKKAEEVFNNEPKLIIRDAKHSSKEERLMLFGKTYQGRLLTVIFTIRSDKVRIISVRDMNRKERKTYEKET